MKKILVIVLAVLVCGISIYAIENVDKSATSYLRIHIRANSNLESDQSVKIKVKESVVNFLTPYLADCSSLDEAKNTIGSNLSTITEICDSVLFENGFTYSSRARLVEEDFPTRVYQDFVLKAGIYDALIIELGSGEGNNWWCVVYPPLCFVNSNTKYEYKSKLLEIINDFKERIKNEK